VHSADSDTRWPRVLAFKELTSEKLRSYALEGTFAERAARLATVLIVALGIWLRLRGFLFSTQSLWLDESDWAIRLIDKPLSEHLIRPIGFMALSKALAWLFSPSETVLRFMPWTAGIATVLMAPALAGKLFRSTSAQLLFVSILALDPAAIDLSKEFKPYSVALTLHVAMVLLAIRYCRSGTTRDLVRVLVTLAFSVLFAQDAIFAYPGLFLVIGVEALRGRRFKHLAAATGTALATASVVACLYFFIWSNLNQSKQESYWGKKYDVFHVPNKSGPTKVEWSFSHYGALVEATGSRRELWTTRRVSPHTLAELVSLDEVVWLVLHIAGLVVIVRARRGRDALLLVAPLGVMALFNWLGFWPQGPFRSNLFSLVYAAGVASCAFDSETKRTRLVDLVPAAVLVLLPLFAFEKTWHRQKEMRSMAFPSAFSDALKALVQQQGRHTSHHREPLVIDTYGCQPFRYYTKYHPLSQTLGKEVLSRFVLKCSGGKDRAQSVLAATRRALRKDDRVWILASHDDVIEAMDRSWPDDLEKVALVRVGGNIHVVVGAKRKEVPTVAEPPAPPAPAEEHSSPEGDPEGSDEP
jgi:hypothetical protein